MVLTLLSLSTLTTKTNLNRVFQRAYYLLNNKEIKLIALIIFYAFLVGAVKEEKKQQLGEKL